MINIIKNCLREYKKTSILSMIFVALEVVMEVLIPFIMAILIDKGIEVSNTTTIIVCCLVLLALSILSLYFGIEAAKCSAKSSVGFTKNVRHDMFHKIQEYSFKNIDDFSTSSLITRLTTDASNIGNAYQMLIRIAVRSPLMFIFSLIMAFTINKKISLIFLLITPLIVLTLFTIGRIAIPHFKDVFETYDGLNNDVQENIRAMRVVKSNVMEKYEINKFNTISDSIYNKFIKVEKIITYISPSMQFAMYLTIILVSWFGSKMIISSSLTTGELTSLITYSATILSSLMMFSMVFVMLTMALTSAKRINEVLETTSTIQSPENALTKIKDGSIEFKNVSFSYINDLERCSLKDINLKIESGQTIGILGSTGSSKTTLVSLISRLYDTTKGEVLIGGNNVKDYDLETLRDKVSVVLQKNVLFSGTIIENLKWGNKNATLKEMKEACSLSQIDDFIETLPDKYETVLEQGATNLSGGQKQRLCIARALLKKPKILILDDSTSAVDTKTDSLIKEGFKKYIPTVTKIIIAQRISSIEDADKVIIMDNGKIIDFDTPKNLLKNSKFYQEIYYSQLKGSEK